MQLLYTPNSPYARRIRVALREADLISRVEELNIDPREDNLAQLLAHGAAAKVPVLVTDDGHGICESLAIANYLDRACAAKLYPEQAAALSRCIDVEAQASALMDSLFVRSREIRRTEHRSQSVITFEHERAVRLYDEMERKIAALSDPTCIDAITLACSLGYADGRHPGDGWREGRPQLTSWYDGMSARASFVETAPSF